MQCVFVTENWLANLIEWRNQEPYFLDFFKKNKYPFSLNSGSSFNINSNMFTNLQIVSIFDILCPTRWLFKLWSVLESLAGYSNLKKNPSKDSLGPLSSKLRIPEWESLTH